MQNHNKTSRVAINSTMTQTAVGEFLNALKIHQYNLDNTGNGPNGVQRADASETVLHGKADLLIERLRQLQAAMTNV